MDETASHEAAADRSTAPSGVKGGWPEKSGFEVVRYTLRVPDFELRRFAGPVAFTEQLDGIRVAHLTDQHVGRVTPHAVQIEAVELANAQEPDLVVLSGDFVCHSQMYLDQLTDVVSRFNAPVFGVLGNHDHWSGSDEVRWALRKGGVELLDNAWSTISIRHQELQVVGVDDAYTGHADLIRATKGLRKGLPSIALSHIAEEADALWDRGIPMVFSGHTHAGQVTLARLHEFILGRVVGHKYVHGLYGERGGDRPGAVYVGAGIGAAVMPLRLGVRGRREVAVFELGAHIGAFEEDHEEQAPSPGRKPHPDLRHKRILEAQRKSAKRRALARRKGINPLGE